MVESGAAVSNAGHRDTARGEPEHEQLAPSPFCRRSCGLCGGGAGVDCGAGADADPSDLWSVADDVPADGGDGGAEYS